MRKIILFILLWLCGEVHGASRVGTTVTASNLTSGEVQSALGLAQAGDTVVLPSGTQSWTSGVVRTDMPANVTVIGNNGTASTTTGGGNNTVITDNISGGSKMFDIVIPTTGVFRLTGITFQSGTGGIKNNGTVNFDGNYGATASRVRIDHCHFIASSDSNYKIVRIGGGVFGLMDHCVLDLTGTNAIYLYNGRSEGVTTDYQGNLEWTLPTNFGSADYFYIEDNVITGIYGGGSPAYATRVYDSFTASKAVVRFNDLAQSCMGETHATGHSPDDRGGRSQEVYGNKATSTLAHDPNYVGLDIGSGTTLVWGNTWNNVYKNLYKLAVVRNDNSVYGQSPTPTGWGYAGTQFNGTGSNWDGGTFNGTNTLLGYPCLDQPGRGPGDMLTGFFPSKTNRTSGSIRWPNQALEPVYIWNNTGTYVAGWGEYDRTFTDVSAGRVVADRDYYINPGGVQTSPTSPFNGTSGVGYGTLANRPTTCTTGVAYWATDQGSWNTSSSNPYGVQQSGADGVLYKATATNTWTQYYTPYTYPHPLQGTADTTAPTPDPMTFSTSPTAVDAFSVTMTASTASDPGGVEYFFAETTGHAGATASGWQSSRNYVDTGLSPSTTYTYTVKARDGSLNETGASSSFSVTTPSSTPGSVNIGTVNVTNLRVGP